MEVPFDHDDIRVYIDNLFLEGVLQPVAHPRAAELTESWAVVGVKTEPRVDRRRRLDGLLGVVDESIPGDSARHQDWLAFAPRWAQVNALWFDPEAKDLEGSTERLRGVRDRVDVSFARSRSNSSALKRACLRMWTRVDRLIGRWPDTVSLRVSSGRASGVECDCLAGGRPPTRHDAVLRQSWGSRATEPWSHDQLMNLKALPPGEIVVDRL